MSGSTGSALTDFEKKEYNSWILKAKDSTSKSKYNDALRHYQQAYKLYPTSKLDSKISKLMKALNIEGTPVHPAGSTEPKRACPFTPTKHEQKRRSPPQSGDGPSNMSMSSSHTVKLENKENARPNGGTELSIHTLSKGSSPLSSTSLAPSGGVTLPDSVPELLSMARDAISEQNVKLALRCYNKAYSIEPSDKLLRRIGRMQAYIDDQSNGAEAKGEEPIQDTATSSMNCAPVARSSATPHSVRGGTTSPPTKSSPANMSDENVAIYNSLLSESKVLEKSGELRTALTLYEQALTLHPSDKLVAKINKVKSLISQLEVDSSGVGAATNPNVEDTDQVAIDAHYSELNSQGRKLVEEERLEEAVVVFRDAYGVKPSDKLQRKIARIEQYLQQQSQTRKAVPQATASTSGQQVTPAKSSEESASEKYNQLILRAKECIAESKVKEALECYKEAEVIKPSDRLSKKIKKCQDYLESAGDDDDSFAHVGNGFYLHQDLYSKLYPHQKESLLWFWGLHKKKAGGILADDMGLGKTIQVISFLSGLFDAEEVKTAIIVMPLSLIENWKREFNKWAPGIQLQTYHGGSQRERARAAAKIQRRGGVLLTSYGMVVSSAELIAKKDGESFGREFTYDYVILDEGHKIKNPTKTSKGVHLIAAKHRIILTGTPIQNNLKEMWALFDWTHHGMLLGTSRTFHTEYNRPITRAREKCATYGERRLGEQMADSLKKIISPYLLRRTKAEVKADARARGIDGTAITGPEMPKMTRKNDFVVWCYLSDLQKSIYESFSEQDEIKELLNTSKSPLTALVVLKKICDHPRLLSNNQCHKLGLFTPQELLGADGSAMRDCAANRIKSVQDNILIEESGKLKFLVQLMARLKAEGHRTLIFSLSRKMLDIIQKVLTNAGHNVMRMDGTITDLSEREKCVSAFQNSDVYDTFLLTTQVGGVGLTLTAADRVVIFDPSWNPATDSQAVDRAFRIGQQKNVCIYRFISCGTIEEKIYRRQIFKDSVNRQTMQKDEKNLFRYFSNHELYELFQLDNPRESKTQQQLEQMHAHQRVTDIALDEHIAYLYSCDMYGLSDHDLMFSKEDEEVDGDENSEYIADRVNKAMELLNKESELQSKMNEEEGKYVPGHLQVLPKPSVKPPPTFDSSKEDDPATSERLFPEYDYSNQPTASNDWRSHVTSDMISSTPNKPSYEPIPGPTRDNTVSEHENSTHQPISSLVSDDVHSVSVEGDSNVAEEEVVSETASINDIATADVSQSNVIPSNISNDMEIAEEVSIQSSSELEEASMQVSEQEKDDSLNAVSTNVMGLSLHDTEATNENADILGEESDTDMAEELEMRSRNEEGAVAAESGDELGSDAAEVLAEDSEGDGDSDGSEEVVEESQSGSMLGDDFGHLHTDYTVRDSDEEGVSASPAVSHRRRSTFLAPVPQSDDEEGEGLEEEEFLTAGESTASKLQNSDSDLTDFEDMI